MTALQNAVLTALVFATALAAADAPLLLRKPTRSASEIAFVYAFRLGQTEKTNPVAGEPTAIREGASLFRANCSPCHGLVAGEGRI